MIPHAQLRSSINFPHPVLISPTITTHFFKPCNSLSALAKGASFIKPFKTNRFEIQPLKCAATSVVSEPPHLELTSDNPRPLPAEISRTIVELSRVGTLSTLAQDGSPLGFGVRFALDFNGTPVLCLSDIDTRFSADRRCSLHVQLEQCGVRTPQCTIVGNLNKPNPSDKIALMKLCSAWKKRFNEEVEESYIYVIDVARALQIEDYGEDGVWVSSSDYALAEPDPLRNCAENFVDEINTNNREDVLRFCNIYADLDIQNLLPGGLFRIRPDAEEVVSDFKKLVFPVLDAKMAWVDRLGFDVRLTSVQKDVYEVRIPFPREVADEKGAKSSFNGMSQLAWEVEKNFHSPGFKKVKHLKKIGNAVQT